MTTDATLTMTIDGAAAPVDAVFDVVDPATGKPFAAAPDCSRVELDAAVAAARRAFSGWCATTHADRQAALRKIAGVLTAHIDELMPSIKRSRRRVASAGFARTAVAQNL